MRTNLVKQFNFDFFERIFYKQSNIDMYEASITIQWTRFELGQNQFHVVVCVFSFWNFHANILAIPVSLSTSTA